MKIFEHPKCDRASKIPDNAAVLWDAGGPTNKNCILPYPNVRYFIVLLQFFKQYECNKM